MVQSDWAERIVQRFNLPDGENIPYQIATFVIGVVLISFVLGALIIVFVKLIKQTHLNNLKDFILSSVTHELKTPLASIRLYNETLLERDLAPEMQKKFLKRALLESDRLQNLIDVILVSAQIESKKNAKSFEPVSLVDVFRDSYNKYKSRYSHTREFHWQSHGAEQRGHPYIMGDKFRLQLVFDNLFDNAVKYSDDKQQITAEVNYDEKQGVTLTVKDEGLGLDKKNLRKIFRKFYRVQLSRGYGRSGSGLGLYLCKKIVKLHKGKITAQSGGVGQGVTINVRFERTNRPY